jgi:hypothetical protein
LIFARDLLDVDVHERSAFFEMVPALHFALYRRYQGRGAPACSSALRGSTISDCSKPSATGMATDFPSCLGNLQLGRGLARITGRSEELTCLAWLGSCASGSVIENLLAIYEMLLAVRRRFRCHSLCMEA